MQTDIATLQSGGALAASAGPQQLTGFSVESDRAIAQIQGRMVMAKRFPRDPNLAIRRIEQACKILAVAEDAEYSFKRGGSVVRGPNIRLAELVIREWGNVDIAVKELSRGNGESHCETSAWDLETGAHWSTQFVVPHRRDVTDGAKDLTSDRDIYEQIANMGSRRVRENIFRIVPAYVVGAALEQCAATMAEENKKKPLAMRIKEMVEVFGSNGVTEGMLAKWLKRPVGEMLETQYIELRSIFRSIKDGVQRVEDFFEKPTVADQVDNNKKRAPAKQEPAKEEKPKEQAKPAEPAKTPADEWATSPQGEPEKGEPQAAPEQLEDGDTQFMRLSAQLSQAKNVDEVNVVGSAIAPGQKHSLSAQQVKDLKRLAATRVKTLMMEHAQKANADAQQSPDGSME